MENKQIDAQQMINEMAQIIGFKEWTISRLNAEIVELKKQLQNQENKKDDGSC